MKRKTLILPRPAKLERPEQPTSATVVGGGLAGVAAATVLAERGVRVRLVERNGYLGGRAGAWTEPGPSGEPFEMERGFHAFFRQYYNVRALLKRIDPELSLLRPMEDYPILGPGGSTESFSGLPRSTPWNVLELTRRTRTMGMRDLMRVNRGAALEMLRYSPERTYAKFDGMSADAYLNSLGFPPEARRMLFDVFAHSFFNPEQSMSAAELLMMFHFYFVGNPEGLIFDVVRQPFSTSIWTPFEEYLEERGVQVLKGTTVNEIERRPAGGFAVRTTGNERFESELLVLATTVPALRDLVERSQGLGDSLWREQIGSLELTLPFAVWRLWLDRSLHPGRFPFAGTTGVGLLDNISLYHLFEDESRDYVAKHGGSIVELHAYAVPKSMGETELRKDLLAGLHAFYPETRGARALHERWLLEQDCPAFAVGSSRLRPRVETPVEGLALAGDFVRLDLPSALMERAVTSGFLAANQLLAPLGVRPEPIDCLPTRGLLAGRERRKPAAGAVQ